MQRNPKMPTGPKHKKARRRPGWKPAGVEAPTIDLTPSEAENVSSVLSEIISGAPASFHIPEGTIVLPARGFKCRPYQRNFWHYMLGKNTKGDGRKKFAVLNWHRRAGKDALLLNLIALLSTRRVGMYWHGFPLLNQARRSIWEGFMNSEGVRMLDYIPPDLREDSNQQELRINLKTGSTYQLVGGDNPDKLTGSGPVGIVWSEYAQMNKAVSEYASPIIGENEGWEVYISTPRGKNHFHDIYQYALHEPGCFAETLTIEDTQKQDKNGNWVPVVDQEYLNKLRRQGKSEEFIRQEFYCDWNSSIDGAVYAKQLRECEAAGHIREVPYNPNWLVHTAWDLGYRDSTVVIFFQLDPSGDDVYLIDFYFNSQQSIIHYCRHLLGKPYRYGCHYAPWDVTSRTLHSENSVMDIARENGIYFTRLLKHGVSDGIESARAAFPRMWFDKTKCDKLLDGLKAYTFSFDDAQKQFGTEPVHDWASHQADAYRYLCKSLPVGRNSSSFLSSHYSKQPESNGECPWDVLEINEPDYA